MSNRDDIAWIPIKSGYFYSVVPLAVQFDNIALQGDTQRFSIPGTEVNDEIRPPIAILSTGLSYNLVPSSIQARFFELMLYGQENVFENDGVFYTSCSTRPANIEILVESEPLVEEVEVPGSQGIDDSEPITR